MQNFEKKTGSCVILDNDFRLPWAQHNARNMDVWIRGVSYIDHSPAGHTFFFVFNQFLVFSWWNHVILLADETTVIGNEVTVLPSRCVNVWSQIKQT